MIEVTDIKDLHYIDVLTVQCGEKIKNCQIVSEDNNEFLYFDKDHFTSKGAQEFGQKLKFQHPELFH